MAEFREVRGSKKTTVSEKDSAGHSSEDDSPSDFEDSTTDNAKGPGPSRRYDPEYLNRNISHQERRRIQQEIPKGRKPGGPKIEM